MRYVSTRGLSSSRSFTQIVMGGLAPDGGLYMPESYPPVKMEELQKWMTLPYVDLAYAVMSRFVDDITPADLYALLQKTYTNRIFAHTSKNANHITPVNLLGREGRTLLYLLELSNGPTLAFKDVALQFLGNLFEYLLEKNAGSKNLNILGATSGDTGSAAEYAVRGKKGIRIFMLSPHGKMSQFQSAQMFSLQDANIFNLTVPGFFDDCQNLVKGVSADLDFKERYQIGTVNSINWARVLAQVVYYFFAYGKVAQKAGEPVSFAVPTGNFGNICAGHVARMMGLPIHQLVLATNENSVLDEFFTTGAYRVRQSAQETSSPSMDISKASNFERFVFDYVGRDSAQVRDLFANLDRTGQFLLETDGIGVNKLSQFGFVSGRSAHANRLETIASVYQMYQRLIDPHTADALKVAREHLHPEIAMVVLETAQPVKFSGTIVAAIQQKPPCPPALEGLEIKPQKSVLIENDVVALKKFIEKSLS